MPRELVDAVVRDQARALAARAKRVVVAVLVCLPLAVARPLGAVIRRAWRGFAGA